MPWHLNLNYEDVVYLVLIIRDHFRQHVIDFHYIFKCILVIYCNEFLLLLKTAITDFHCFREHHWMPKNIIINDSRIDSSFERSSSKNLNIILKMGNTFKTISKI